MKTEIWKAITGYGGYYEVSNLGRVKSITRKIERRNPKDASQLTLYTYTGAIIEPFITKKGGYERCTLNIDGNKRNHLVHRLVALEFIDNPERKEQVNHINCIKTDNNINNLEWVTNEENYRHSVENGLQPYQNY